MPKPVCLPAKRWRLLLYGRGGAEGLPASACPGDAKCGDYKGEAARCVTGQRLEGGEHQHRRHNIEGKWDETKGEVKEQAGKLTGDEELESEGKIDQAEGNVEQAWDKAKDAVDDLTD